MMLDDDKDGVQWESLDKLKREIIYERINISMEGGKGIKINRSWMMINMEDVRKCIYRKLKKSIYEEMKIWIMDGKGI